MATRPRDAPTAGSSAVRWRSSSSRPHSLLARSRRSAVALSNVGAGFRVAGRDERLEVGQRLREPCAAGTLVGAAQEVGALVNAGGKSARRARCGS